MLETEYNEEEVLKIVAEDARREGEKNGIKIGEENGKKIGKKIGKEIATEMLTSLMKKLSPGSDEFDRVINGTQEDREALYRKYEIKERAGMEGLGTV